ncbi:predicted protein [Streptomyces viridosporus ATCC 14672]|uniref:Predicted protein n=1 Tax=Streptomyces viridosporus (strain ATCC 14672 / DSM 40746 / JCM 4963 / KCTC 9882 / NRRL B-12104 / FH 1290) TaxID=566461 RepID=D6A5G9_STRV1|nr:predicted protein [Streptomyces viridosporus ATCC 14672]
MTSRSGRMVPAPGHEDLPHGATPEGTVPLPDGEGGLLVGQPALTTPSAGKECDAAAEAVSGEAGEPSPENGWPVRHTRRTTASLCGCLENRTPPATLVDRWNRHGILLISEFCACLALLNVPVA